MESSILDTGNIILLAVTYFPFPVAVFTFPTVELCLFIFHSRRGKGEYILDDVKEKNGNKYLQCTV